MTVTEALHRCGGVARVRDLLALGCTRHRLAQARARGDVVEVARGVLALPATAQARIEAARLHGTLTCATALEERSVPLLGSPPAVCVEVAGSGYATRQRGPGIRVHFHQATSPPMRAFRIATVAEALDAAGRCLDERAHLVAVDAALHRGLVRPDEIAQFRRSTAARRAWIQAFMDGRAESPPESLARLDLALAGVRVHPQRYIEGVGRVDLVAADRVVVEVDGRQFHDDTRAFQRDRSRDRELARQGYAVLRFTYLDLCGEAPVSVAQAVQAALAGQRRTRPLHR
ncbi:MAG: DUF559 domain-containing protein [Demequina sp.]|uniref:DUF559 domain-containing protein n=1 Tax=Demequina sp. TaxID=2050685 RepID=UPI003A864583